MCPDDKKRFSDMLDELGMIYDRQISVDLKKLYWTDLNDLPIDAVEQAAALHRRDTDRGRFWPRPADLRYRCRSDDEHPPVDVAWAVALESYDECASVVWTDAIERARNAALPVWESGDRIGARMAFRAAYQVIVERSPQPAWKLSTGVDPAQRVHAVERARAAGLIGAEHATMLMPSAAASPDMKGIAGLLAGKVLDFPAVGSSDDVRARSLRNMRAIIESAEKPSPKKKADSARRARVEAEKRRLNRILAYESDK